MNETISITGLWEKDTRAGKLLSAKLNEATRLKLTQELDKGDCEMVIWTNTKRESEKSPTHRLVISRRVDEA